MISILTTRQPHKLAGPCFAAACYIALIHSLLSKQLSHIIISLALLGTNLLAMKYLTQNKPTKRPLRN